MSRVNYAERERWRWYRKQAVIDQDYCCYWCGKRIMDTRLLDPSQIVSMVAPFLIYLEDGRRKMALLATADHVYPRGYGGRTTRQNIVATCRPCNHGRTKDPDQTILPARRREYLRRYDR